MYKGKLIAIAVAMIVFTFGFSKARAEASFPTSLGIQMTASCGAEPNMVGIRVLNQTNQTIKVTGEIWAEPEGQTASLISTVPIEYQLVKPGEWGGPEERVGDAIPGFAGTVWGTIKVYLNDNLIGSTELAPSGLNCQQANDPILIGSQLIMACGVEPNQVEIRIHNQTNKTVKVTGEIWAEPEGQTASLISTVPIEYQLVKPGEWGGPEERIENHFYNFKGRVWGSAEVSSLDGALMGRFNLEKTDLNCDPPAVYTVFLPIVSMPKDLSCSDLTMIVSLPNRTTVSRTFGETPGPIYTFGNVFKAGETISYATGDGLAAKDSYLGWYNMYLSTGIGPKWDLKATSQRGTPPLLGMLYTWRATKELSNGTECSIGFQMQWDP